MLSKKAKRMTRILWLNRHRPTSYQINQLENYFGAITLIERVIGFDTDPQIGVDQIQQLMTIEQADEIIAVVPLSHVAELIKRGIKPLRAIMKREPTDSINNRGEIEFDYIHEGFEKITSASITSEKIT